MGFLGLQLPTAPFALTLGMAHCSGWLLNRESRRWLVWQGTAYPSSVYESLWCWNLLESLSSFQGCMFMIKKHWSYLLFAWERVSPRHMSCFELLACFSLFLCVFVCDDETLWGSAMPAFSCQYLDKDELLHLAGANKEHICIHLDYVWFCLFVFCACFAMLPCSFLLFCSICMLASTTECLAWQVFSTQGVASQIRALPAVFGAFWDILSTNII